MNALLIDKPIISADSHVVEPVSMYDGRLPKKFTAPYMVRQGEGDVIIIDGMDDPYPVGMASAAGKRGPALIDYLRKAALGEGHTGGHDPVQRLLDQDTDGVAAELLYPSLGMHICNHTDPEYKDALFAAYNEWMAEYCAYAPNRLIGMGQTGMSSPQQGIRDLEQIKRLGLRGVMMPGTPLMEDYDSRIYDDFYAAAVDLGIPLSFHIFTYRNDLAKPRGPKINIHISVIRGNQDLIGTMIFGGVFERFPKLKLVCVEADAGWAPHFAYKMDHAFEITPHWLGDVTLSKPPSEYFWENVYVTFQEDKTALPMRHLLNMDRLLWANDFPHVDSTWPNSKSLLAEFTADLTVAEKTKLLHDNVAGLYGLTI